MRSSHLRSESQLLLASFIWGMAFVAQRVGMDYMGPFTFNAVRFALGALVLAPWIGRRRAEHSDGEGMPARHALLIGGGLAGTVLFMGASLQQSGLQWTTAGNAGFITGLYVVIVPLLGLTVGHRAGWPVWLGAGLAALGLYFLSVRQGLRMQIGDVLVLVGAFTWALHVHVIGHFSARLDALKLAFAQFAVCSILSSVVALIVEQSTLASVRQAWLPLAYAGVLSTGVAFTLQVVGQRRTPPAPAAIILSLEAVFAALGGWLMLGERMDARAITGCSLMLAAVLLAQTPALRGRHKPPPAIP